MQRPTLLAAACLALAGSAGADGFAERSALETLSGTWVSRAPEPWYGGWGAREFVFADGTWSLIFTHALDRDMTQRTFQFRTGGSYAVAEPSEAVPGAFHAVFDEDWKRVTLLTADPGLAAAMGLGDCGLTPNLEADISATGCGPWPAVEACGVDHDLLAMDAAGLYFGVRPADNDLCSADRLPEALLSPVAKR